MRRIDSQLNFFVSGFATLALAVFVLPACDGNDSGNDSGSDTADTADSNDSGTSGIVAPTVSTSSVPARLALLTGSCGGFELVGQLNITNGGQNPIEFSNNFDPGEVIDSSPSAGTVAAGESVGLLVFADCSGGPVNGFLQLTITDTDSGSPNTGSLNIPVSLVAGG
jgi:hypothetical protein